MNDEHICEMCGEVMEWREGEVECDMCYGEGIIYHDANQINVKCSFCSGTGTVEASGWFCPEGC